MTFTVDVCKVDVCVRGVVDEEAAAREDDCIEVLVVERVRVLDLPDELVELLIVTVDEVTVEELVVELGP